MRIPRPDLLSAVSALVILAGLPISADAALFEGDLFYTRFDGFQNVNKVHFTYEDSTNAAALGTPVNITTTPGADGILFAPNGNLLIGGQGTNTVFEVNPATGGLVASGAAGQPSFHLTLDPAGNKVYTSTFGGDLSILPFGPHIQNAGPIADVTGDDGGLTQITFNSDGSKVYYVNGNPNGFGNIGIFDLTTFITDRLYSGQQSAHGMVFDPFTDRITFFGAGKTGSMSAADGSDLRQSATTFTCDFDQGAVDGQGHALVAGCGSITFIDYRLSGDITNPDFFQVFGGFPNIDDVAPLVGPGSNPPPPPTVPEPATLAIFGLGTVGLILARRRRV